MVLLLILPFYYLCGYESFLGPREYGDLENCSSLLCVVVRN